MNWLATTITGATIIALSSAAVLAVLSIEPPGGEPVERVMAPPARVEIIKQAPMPWYAAPYAWTGDDQR